MTDFDVVIIGAGAAGMMCAIEAGKRGRRALVLEHNAKPGEKIRISGGGRCNFTNLGSSGANYLSKNPKFALSALKRYTQHDFVALVNRHGIAWHEKTLGQLFCDGSALQIIAMLTQEMNAVGAELRCGVSVKQVAKTEGGFEVVTSAGVFGCPSLVIACGGKSIPKMGASNFGYKVAEQFGLEIVETRPALVPLTFGEDVLAETAALSGVAVEAIVGCGKRSFREALLFTHRGLSGPAILQISSFWREGETLAIDLAPGIDVLSRLKEMRNAGGKRDVSTALGELLPNRLAHWLAAGKGKIAEQNDKALAALARRVKGWQVQPVGTEGYRTAEVTFGGVATGELDARTMMARRVPGLYFIGEVVDVTGWLGGYNFQWAWSSGWAAGQAV